MVARIAPSPIATPIAFGDTMAHAADTAATRIAQQETRAALSADEQHIEQQQVAAATPPPPPPGEAFAAAVISGQLAPKPLTPEELRQRLGSSWQPPSSPLRLMDKVV